MEEIDPSYEQLIYIPNIVYEFVWMKNYMPTYIYQL